LIGARHSRYARRDNSIPDVHTAMRYLLQFGIPALIFLAVLIVVAHRRRQAQDEGSGGGAFLVILVVGAAVAVATLFALQAIAS
jgi:hypothetical protein